MQFPIAPLHMYDLRNQIVNNFSYDQTKQIQYSFNSLGFRGPEFKFEDPILLLGGSIAFGIGIPFPQTFGNIIEKKISYQVYNLAWGGYAHTNHEQLDFFKRILDSVTPRYVIWQINNLNRVRDNSGTVSFDNNKKLVVELFYDFYTQAKQVLNEIPHTFIHWDNEHYNIDFTDCLIYNKYHVDSTPINNFSTFGIKSNRLIAEKILEKLNEKL